MRHRTLLTAALLATSVAGCAAHAPLEPATPDGLVPLRSSGAGATLILSGTLSRETFRARSVTVVESPLAGKQSDPDQFRLTLRDRTGRKLETISTWSPLLRLEWDAEGQHESARPQARRAVTLSVPVRAALDAVALSWPEGQVVATVDVGFAVQRFCRGAPHNPACSR